MGNDGLSSKQVGSQASHRVTRRLAWIQPVCININAVPALNGLIISPLRQEILIQIEKTSVASQFNNNTFEKNSTTRKNTEFSKRQT